MGNVYKIENEITGKIYIGGTSQYLKRVARHLSDLRKGKHHSVILQKDYDSLGEDSFTFQILHTSPEYKIIEQEYLDKMNWDNSYNISASSTAGNLIKNHPDRARIIAQATANLALAPQPEPKFGSDNGNWRGGRKQCVCGTFIARTAMSCINCTDKTGSLNPFYNKKHTEATKTVLRKANSGRYLGDQERKVIVENKEFKSVSEAARQLGVSPALIIYRIKSKKYNYAYGS